MMCLCRTFTENCEFRFSVGRTEAAKVYIFQRMDCIYLGQKVMFDDRVYSDLSQVIFLVWETFGEYRRHKNIIPQLRF